MKRHSVRAVLFFLLVAGSIGGVWAAETSLAPKEKKFLTESASGGLMEVQLGQMAQQKAQARDVKNFGNRMLTDHAKANDELKKLIDRKDASLPVALAPRHKKTVDKFSQLTGADFDKKYMNEMVKDHAEDVATFKKAGQAAIDQDLKSWIEKTLPVLEQHLEQAKTTAQKLGVDVSKAEREGRKEAEKKKM